MPNGPSCPQLLASTLSEQSRVSTFKEQSRVSTFREQSRVASHGCFGSQSSETRVARAAISEVPPNAPTAIMHQHTNQPPRRLIRTDLIRSRPMGTAITSLQLAS